jgi:hypothetical protein
MNGDDMKLSLENELCWSIANEFSKKAKVNGYDMKQQALLIHWKEQWKKH